MSDKPINVMRPTDEGPRGETPKCPQCGCALENEQAKRVTFERSYAAEYANTEMGDTVEGYCYKMMTERQPHGYSGKWFNFHIDKAWRIFCDGWNGGKKAAKKGA